MWDVQNVRCWGCRMFRMWNVLDVGCLGYQGCWVFRMWGAGGVRCSGCGIQDVSWDVGCQFIKCHFSVLLTFKSLKENPPVRRNLQVSLETFVYGNIIILIYFKVKLVSLYIIYKLYLLYYIQIDIYLYLHVYIYICIHRISIYMYSIIVQYNIVQYIYIYIYICIYLYICIIYVYIERGTYILDNLDNLIEIVQLLITLLK